MASNPLKLPARTVNPAPGPNDPYNPAAPLRPARRSQIMVICAAIVLLVTLAITAAALTILASDQYDKGEQAAQITSAAGDNSNTRPAP